MPDNKRTARDCAPSGPDETRTSRPQPNQGVGQRERVATATALLRAAVRQVNPEQHHLGRLLASAAGWLDPEHDRCERIEPEPYTDGRVVVWVCRACDQPINEDPARVLGIARGAVTLRRIGQ